MVEPLERRRCMSVGLAFVGMSAAAGVNVDYLATQMVTHGGDREVSFLPFEFNPASPFGNATTLVTEALPGLRGTLRLTVDLKWFAHKDPVQDAAQTTFWAAWDTARPSAAQGQIRTDFLSRVQAADAWVNQTRSWATARGLQNALKITFVPVLEDTDASSAAYSRLVGSIRSQQKADHTSTTPLRRSPNGYAHVFRVAGASLELHGYWKDVKDSLVAGDTWSNDGTRYGIDSFVADGRLAKNVVTGSNKSGVGVLYWNTDMNGDSNIPGTNPYTNWAARAVNPFSGSTASNDKARLTAVLGI